MFSWSAIARGFAETPDDASRVAIEISPQGTGCELTLTHEAPAEWADYADRTKWTKITDELAKALS